MKMKQSLSLRRACRALAMTAWAWAALLSQPVHAQADLPAACLKSFAVKDRPFASGAATMSCRLTETRRGDLFAAITSMKDTGEIDGAKLIKDLSAIEARLNEEESRANWGGLVNAITGNGLATISLAACTTLTPGCGLAVVGKVLSWIGVIDAAKSEADRKKTLAQVRSEIDAIKKGAAGKKTDAKAARDRLIADAKQLCEDVQKHCL